MATLTNKQRFILNNLLVLVAILLGVGFVVACINMPINQSTNEIARFVFSAVVVIAPLTFFAIVVMDDYKLYNKNGFKYYPSN
jgi:hypothetical protein